MKSHICGTKQPNTNEVIYKTETGPQTWKTNSWLPEEKSCGRRYGGINWEFAIDMYTLLYLRQITNKNLPHSTRISAQYSLTT